MKDKKIYLIGSLRNEEVPKVANEIRKLGFNVFDDWFAAGPEADDWWKTYEQGRNHTYAQAMDGFAADHVFQFDKHHLDTSDIVILMLPAGKSGHLELGYSIGKGKIGYILLDDKKDRWDVMYMFTSINGGKVCHTFDELKKELKKHAKE